MVGRECSDPRGGNFCKKRWDCLADYVRAMEDALRRGEENSGPRLRRSQPLASGCNSLSPQPLKGACPPYAGRSTREERMSKGYRGYIRESDGTIMVGAERKPDKSVDGDTGYSGPCARITFDRDWLYICTDDYEGNAMLNIEALPNLRRALARVAKRVSALSDPTRRGR